MNPNPTSTTVQDEDDDESQQLSPSSYLDVTRNGITVRAAGLVTTKGNNPGVPYFNLGSNLKELTKDQVITWLGEEKFYDIIEESLRKFSLKIAQDERNLDTVDGRKVLNKDRIREASEALEVLRVTLPRMREALAAANIEFGKAFDDALSAKTPTEQAAAQSRAATIRSQIQRITAELAAATQRAQEAAQKRMASAGSVE